MPKYKALSFFCVLWKAICCMWSDQRTSTWNLKRSAVDVSFITKYIIFWIKCWIIFPNVTDKKWKNWEPWQCHDLGLCWCQWARTASHHLWNYEFCNFPILQGNVDVHGHKLKRRWVLQQSHNQGNTKNMESRNHNYQKMGDCFKITLL